MPDLADVLDARLAIAHKIRRTPLVRSESLSTRVGAPVYLKLEHHQITGSFKLRGATFAVHRLTAAQRAKGVVGVSTGNHGRGLAQAAKDAGLRCVVCMSSLVPKNKVEAIRALGADVRIVGASQDEAQVEVDRLVAEDGLTLLPPFDHPHVIAGQGTLGVEIVEELPRVDTLIVPLSGGGLIAGVALAAKTLRPSLRVIGVTMERGAAMYESLKAGHPVPVEERPSLADALGGGIGLDNRYTFPMVRDLVDGVHLVSEGQIGDGIRHAYWQEKQVIEGSGAAGIAALLAGLVDDPGTTAVIVSGCNIDMDLHKRVIDGDVVDIDGSP
jgi:threonine dehydratase